MSNVYVVKDGKTEPMTVVHVKNEDKELQTILNNNFKLLPGDQIEPEEECRWMLIKREMPVPDTVTGADRYSIDFFFVDQNAKPTFVECKRRLDTRSRREVVGQVLEYAANAQCYWSADYIRSQAELTAQENQTTVDELFRAIHSKLTDSSEDFFKEVEKNLKASQIRIVFFLDEAPNELKRLVEFMNTQMGSIDVLLVEAKQYEANGVRVVVPTLFGFTETIRQTKLEASTQQSRQSVAVDWESFKMNAEQRGLDEQTVTAMQKVYDVCISLRANISWGRGTVAGSFSPKWPNLRSTAAPFSIYSDGNLAPRFPEFHKSEVTEAFSAKFGKSLLAGGLELPPDYQNKWFSFKPKEWVPHVDVFIAALRDALGKEVSQPE